MATKKELSDARVGHIALWEWLAESGAVSKSLWPGWERNGGTIPRIKRDCFACYISFPDCSECPISWGCNYDGMNMPCSDCIESPYREWESEDDHEKRKLLAAMIATMWAEYQK